MGPNLNMRSPSGAGHCLVSSWGGCLEPPGVVGCVPPSGTHTSPPAHAWCLGPFQRGGAAVYIPQPQAQEQRFRQSLPACHGLFPACSTWTGNNSIVYYAPQVCAGES